MRGAIAFEGRQRQPNAGRETPLHACKQEALLMMGACDKALQAAYHRNHIPTEKQHQPWIDDCAAQVINALAAVDAMIDADSPYLLLGRLTQADITAFIAERLARAGQLRIDTDTQMPRLRALTRRLIRYRAFSSTEP